MKKDAGSFVKHAGFPKSVALGWGAEEISRKAGTKDDAEEDFKKKPENK